jgi:pimeloyl-ACP methyl ester carboxylesterase
MVISRKQRLIAKRVFWVFIPAVLVFVAGFVILNFYFIHRLTHPPRTELYGTPRDFQVILQKPMWFDEKWKNSDSTEAVGWLLSRGTTAPAIVLSHSYGGNRSELLTLSFELWKAGYHVLVYDLRGHGESPVKWSGLGAYEVDDLLSAIRFLKNRKTEAGQQILDGRVGLYGVGLGGYVSLVASKQDPNIKSVAVDSPYTDVAQFINHRLKIMIGNDSSIANNFVDSSWTKGSMELATQLYLLRRQDMAPATEAVSTGSERRFMFLTRPGAGVYESMSRDLHMVAKEPKQFLEVEHSRLERLYDKASADYDSRIVEFFKQSIPIASDKQNEKPGQMAKK